VIENALNLLAPGGNIFIGDVRNLALLHCFAFSVQISKADPTTSVHALRQKISRFIEKEKELLLAPEFFALLPKRFASLAGVDIQIKRGRSVNELTRYRYDVVLSKATPKTTIDLEEPAVLRWGQEVDGFRQ